MSLAACVGIPLAAVTIQQLVSAKRLIKWYKDLKKPKWTPPFWLFSLLELGSTISMGTASWFIWKKGFKEQKVPLVLYGIQFALGYLCIPVFYHMRKLGLILAESLVLDVVLVATTVAFFKESKKGGSLLIPYVAYVYFCTAFTARIHALNKGDGATGAPTASGSTPAASATRKIQTGAKKTT